jgi:hypothetical protein
METAKHLANVQIASLTALPFWFPFWKLSTVEVISLYDDPRPKRSQLLNKDLYSGIKLTSFLPLYPVAAAIKLMIQKETRCSDVIGAAFGGMAISPFCAYHKTKILCPQVMWTYSFLNISLSTKANHIEKYLKWPQLRGVSLYCVRNSIIVPCIFYGNQETKKMIFPKKYQMENPIQTQLISTVVPAFIATCISHPIDMLTTLLNSDPYKLKYFDTAKVYKEFIYRHGWKGFTIGLLPRFLSLTIECAIFGQVMKTQE